MNIMSEKKLSTFDLTIFDDVQPEDIKTVFVDIAKDWAFQHESGEVTGRLHYQCRIRLKVRSFAGTLANKLRKLGLENINCKETSNVNKDNNFYVLKDETRVAGPWTSQEEANNIVTPRDVKAMTQLRPFQTALVEMSKNIDNDRIVDVIIDTAGNTGKTKLTRYMMCNKLAQLVPFCNDFKDMMRMVMDMPVSNCYLIDMPRAISKDKLNQLYSAIELVKGGYAYDDRYSFKQKLFDPPNMFVFTNKIPDFNLLTRDRWRLWSINDLYELVPYVSEKNGFEEDISDEGQVTALSGHVGQKLDKNSTLLVVDDLD